MIDSTLSEAESKSGDIEKERPYNGPSSGVREVTGWARVARQDSLGFRGRRGAGVDAGSLTQAGIRWQNRPLSRSAGQQGGSQQGASPQCPESPEPARPGTGTGSRKCVCVEGGGLRSTTKKLSQVDRCREMHATQDARLRS